MTIIQNPEEILKLVEEVTRRFQKRWIDRQCFLGHLESSDDQWEQGVRAVSRGILSCERELRIMLDLIEGIREGEEFTVDDLFNQFV